MRPWRFLRICPWIKKPLVHKQSNSFKINSSTMKQFMLGVALLFFSGQSISQDSIKIAIIIDDLGNNYSVGKQLIDMPYQMTYAILPKRPYTVQLANLAAYHGKEVMVHLPMQSSQQQELGNGALTMDQTRRQFMRTVQESIESVPYARGVNNHMGSLLTRHPGHMAWLMETLSLESGNLYFVDSKTTAQTIAGQIAREHLVPNIARDVFLDSVQNEDEINKQLIQLLNLAKEKGYAVAIGHPYAETIESLRKFLPRLSRENIEVVPVTTLVELNNESIWPRYSYRLPAAVKN